MFLLIALSDACTVTLKAYNIQVHMLRLIQHKDVVAISSTEGIKMEIIEGPANIDCQATQDLQIVMCTYEAKYVKFVRMVAVCKRLL